MVIVYLSFVVNNLISRQILETVCSSESLDTCNNQIPKWKKMQS